MAKNTRLTLRAFEWLDGGRVARGFEHFMSKIVADCHARPSMKKSRKLIIEVEITPADDSLSANEGLESIVTSVTFSTKVPAYRSSDYVMTPTHDGKVLFNPDRPDDPNAATLFDAEERAEQEAGEG